jgi:hypothetical protein
MKTHIAKITVLSLLAAAMVTVPVLVHAQDAKTNATSSNQTTPPNHKIHSGIPFRGKLNAVDTKAMTLTVGNRTFQVTADTKIFNNGAPAALSDGVVGGPVRGAYKKTEAGKLEALSVHFGVKGAEKQKTEGSTGN